MAYRWLTAAGLLLAAGCGEMAMTHPPVPPVPVEAVPIPPRSQTVMIYQPGHWSWTGSRYAWIAGTWVERAGHGTLWQDGYWRGVGRNAEWVPGHWL